MKILKFNKFFTTLGKNVTALLLSASFVFPAGAISGCSDGNNTEIVDSAEEFNAFLERCTQEERVFLMQSMGTLPKIPREAFGVLSATVETPDGKEETVKLDSYESFEDDARPKTFNELPPVLVLKAVEKGYLNNLWSPKEIKKKLCWHANHWAVYLVTDKTNVDYRKIVEWCAQKETVVGEPELTDEQIASMSTHELSQVVTERYYTKRFNDLWEKLGDEDKGKTLDKLEEETGRTLTDFQRKTLIGWDEASNEDKERVCRELNESNNSGGQIALASSMGAGAVALGGLGVTVSTMGFAFYTGMSHAIAVAGSYIGVSFSGSLYYTASQTVCFLSGPWGWCIAGGLLVVAPFTVGWKNANECANFVAAKYSIESAWSATESADDSSVWWKLLVVIIILAGVIFDVIRKGKNKSKLPCVIR